MNGQGAETRKYYIDNLRNYTILLLFPVHTFMIWNDFGSRFYIWQGENRILSTCIVAVNPWFMPLLFVLAGMSARFALERRSFREFVVQRIRKLLIPFICGMLLLVPFQSLFARKFFYHYTGSLWEHWVYFFTHVTDLSGYDGGFTPGHLWFVLFLFLISLFAVVLFRFIPYERAALRVEKMPVLGVVFLFIPVWLMYYLGNFGGFSIGKDLALFWAGYYVLSNDVVIGKLEHNGKWLAGLWGIVTVVSVGLYYRFSYYGDLWVNFIGWISILALLVMGKRYLDEKTRVTEYLNHASYPIYLLHQSILVALAYEVLGFCDILWLQVVCIGAGSFLLTLLAYHLIKRIPGLRIMVGIY